MERVKSLFQEKNSTDGGSAIFKASFLQPSWVSTSRCQMERGEDGKWGLLQVKLVHGIYYFYLHLRVQGFPTPRPWAITDLWPVRNWAAQQEVSSEQGSEVSPVLTATPRCSQSLGHGKIVFHETSSWCQKGWASLPQSVTQPCYPKKVRKSASWLGSHISIAALFWRESMNSQWTAS